MIEDATVLTTIWETVREYIPAKELQATADHLVQALLDIGVEEDIMFEFGKVDKYVKNAVKEQISIEELDFDDADPEDE